MSVTGRRRAGLFMAGMLWAVTVLDLDFKLGVTRWWEYCGTGLMAFAVSDLLYRWWMS